VRYHRFPTGIPQRNVIIVSIDADTFVAFLDATRASCA
jgi:hypothetical protein